ncbi:hypothetical protein ABZ784_01220 [Streptomyces tendae]|uniref:hypothetical protein n=1 Tax=Streptomyces tendae TaxID=1932 RepID=UPI0033EDCE63
MTLLRDHDLARAFDHASHTYDHLTALNPGHHTGLLRSARRLALPDDGAGLHLLDLGCTLYRHLRHSVVAFDTAPGFAARLTRAGLTSVRVAPVAGWQTGIVHTFLARSGGPETTEERVL